LARAAGQNVGLYAINVGTLSAGTNYTLTLAAAVVNFEIKPKLLTVTAPSRSRVYGAPDPVLTANDLTFGGFEFSDDKSSLGGTPAFSFVDGANVSVTPTSPAGGTYKIKVSGYTSTNYVFSYVDGTLTINKANTTVTSSNQTLNEGVATIALSATVASVLPSTAAVNEGTVTFTVKRGAATVGTLAANVSAGSATATYPTPAGGPLQPDAYTVEVKFNESTNFNTSSTSATATINNGSLVITQLISPSVPVAVGAPTTITGQFTDPGLGNGTYTVIINLSVLGTFTCTSAAPAGGCSITAPTSSTPGKFTLAGSFATASVNVVDVTVKDAFTAQDSKAAPDYFVVYDASAGFVTGGGWIDSPVGACKMSICTSATVGKANFGFVSKYKKGQSTPDGNTEFQFKAGNINFHSEDYEWLVVAGAKAQFKGSGTINGSGDFGFLLTAVDGQITGGGGIDKFRIKIWDKANPAVMLYDNLMDAPDDAMPTTVLGGGSINIQAK
jgi:hypothetical protein